MKKKNFKKKCEKITGKDFTSIPVRYWNGELNLRAIDGDWRLYESDNNPNEFFLALVSRER